LASIGFIFSLDPLFGPKDARKRIFLLPSASFVPIYTGELNVYGRSQAMSRMRVYVTMLVLLWAAGCSATRGPEQGRAFAPGSDTACGRQASEHLRGFMDGYHSAFPERGRSQDLRAYSRHSRYRHDRPSAYRDGWDSGLRTGTNDERRRR
jgi:hypothetical protein